jgi:hypothetical protein
MSNGERDQGDNATDVASSSISVAEQSEAPEGVGEVDILETSQAATAQPKPNLASSHAAPSSSSPSQRGSSRLTPCIISAGGSISSGDVFVTSSAVASRSFGQGLQSEAAKPQLNDKDRTAMQVEGTAFDTPLLAARRLAIAEESERVANEPEHAVDSPAPFRNDTSLRAPDIKVPPPPSNPLLARPPPVREPKSLRVPNRHYQNIEGVPSDTSPFVGVPLVRHPVDATDTGYGPAPRETQSAQRHTRGITPYQLSQAALAQRLTHARGILRSAESVLYNALWSQAPPSFVDIRMLGNVQITAAELLTVSNVVFHMFYLR